MRLTAIASLSAALMTGTAISADMIVYDDFAPAVMASTDYDWTGFYVGINGGHAGGTFEHPLSLDVDVGGGDFENLATGSVDVTSSGFLYGVQGGYNWQFDENILFGIEGDIQGSTVDGRVSLSITDTTGAFLPDPGDTIEADAGTRLDWLATLRPRIGFVQDRFVVYGTGGLAYGQTTSSLGASFEGTELFEVEEQLDRWGYTVGAGIEYALADNITFKTEYLYTDLGTEEIVSGEILPDLYGSLDSTVSFHTVRAGLNFRF